MLRPIVYWLMLYAGKEKTKEAKGVISIMMKDGIKPNIITYNCLMVAYFLVDEVNKANGLFTLWTKGIYS